MTSKRRRATAVVLAALLVAGTSAAVAGAVTGQWGASDAPRLQETTTDGDSDTVAVRNLSAPSEVEVGTAFTVSADIVNEGGSESVYEVTYHIAGNVVNATLVRVAPNATETVVFNVSADDMAGFPTGTFTQGVFVDGAAATANLTLTDGEGAATQTGEETTAAEVTTETTETEAPEDTTTTTETETPTQTETDGAQVTNETTETPTVEAATETTTTTEAPTETEADGAQAAEVTAETEETPATETPEEEETETTQEDQAAQETTTTPAEATTTTEVATEEDVTTVEETTTTEDVTPAEETTTVTQTPAETATPTPTPEDEAAADTASLTFENQTSNGSAVTVQSVTVPEGGFVVVHDNSLVEGEVVDSILGTSDYLEAGTTENVTVELTEPLDQSQRLVAVAYRDSNDNRTFDLVTSNRTADGPYTKADSREAVNGIAVVDVEGEAANATDA